MIRLAFVLVLAPGVALAQPAPQPTVITNPSSSSKKVNTTTVSGKEALDVYVKGGGGSGGTSSSFGSAFPGTGTAVGAKDSAGTNMQPLNLDASGNLKVIDAAASASDATATGSLTSTTCAGSGCITLTPPVGASAWSIDLRGTWVATVQFEGTIDGTNYVAVSANPANDPSGTAVSSATATGSWRANIAGFVTVRVRASAYTSGSVTVSMRATTGLINDKAGGGSSSGATQYDEDTASADGEKLNMMGVVRKDTRASIAGTDGDRTELQVNSSGDLRVDGSAVTQPVSGTVTVTDGSGALNTIVDSLTLPNEGQQTKANSISVALASDQDALPVTDNGGSLTVDGTVSVSGTVAVDQATAAEADYDTGGGTVNQTMLGLALPGSGGPVAGGTSSNPVRTDPTGTTAQPITDNGGSLTVDGTVTITDGAGAVNVIVDSITAGDNNIGNVDVASLPDEGQQTMANSVSVAIASNQSTLNVNCTSGCSSTPSTEDEDAFTVGTTAVAVIAGQRDDASSDQIAEGEVGGVRMSADRAIHVHPGTGAAFPVTDNGSTLSVDDGAGSLTVDGTVTVTDGSGALNVIVDSGSITASGNKTNNNAAPGATNVGTLPAVANAAAPTQTEGNQVALRAQLDGDLVVVMEDELPAGTQNIGDVDIASLPNEGEQTAANSISVTLSSDNDPIGATGSAVPGEAILTAGTDGTNTTAFYVDPCEREQKYVYRVDIVTATTTEVANQVASEYFYICSINLVSAGANNVVIVEDDTDVCASPTAGVSSGGTTAAEGWNFAANGGLTLGNGKGWVMSTTTANRYLCIITSAAVQLSGTITFVSSTTAPTAIP